MESLAAIYRPAALFLTNKENFVADNGDFAGTVINSSNMLWSLSGNLSMVHRLIFGIEFQPAKLVFHPFVPKALRGNRSLNNFKYRNATLNISMEGFGNTIQSFLLDGKKLAVAEISENLKGEHNIKIVLVNNNSRSSSINKVENHVSPSTPLADYSANTISWQRMADVAYYRLLKNGSPFAKTNQAEIKVSNDAYAEYQLIAIDNEGFESFASEPLVVTPAQSVACMKQSVLLQKRSRITRASQVMALLKSARRLIKR
jgi:hypothetical protein